MPKYYFTPPTVDEGPLGPDRLSQFYTLPRGITVLKNDGVYEETRYPLANEVRDADAAYVGGHVHEVSAEEAASLIAAGYEDYITEI